MIYLGAHLLLTYKCYETFLCCHCFFASPNMTKYIFSFRAQLKTWNTTVITLVKLSQFWHIKPFWLNSRRFCLSDRRHANREFHELLPSPNQTTMQIHRWVAHKQLRCNGQGMCRLLDFDIVGATHWWLHPMSFDRWISAFFTHSIGREPGRAWASHMIFPNLPVYDIPITYCERT